MSDVVVVLGMHRSGTSAVAGALTKLGGGPPKRLMAATPANARGYFESVAFMQFHDELLESAGSNWRDWRPFNPGWRRSPVAADFRGRAKELFAEEFGRSALPVLKDPRICRFVPFWLDVLRDMQATPRIVMPIRSPLDVARSLSAAQGTSLTQGLLLWLRHVLDAEAQSRHEARSIFTWQEFRADWRAVCEKIGAETHLSWPRLSDRAARDVERFLAKELVHHDTDHAALVAHADVHEWTVRAYEALLELARNSLSNSALATLDDVRALLDQSSKLFGRLLIDYEVDLEHIRGQADAAAGERDALRARQSEILAEKAAALAELAARAEQAEKARDEAAREKETLSQSLGALFAERDALEAANCRVVADLQARRQELTEKAAALAEQAARAEQAERARDEAARENAALARSLADSAADQAAASERAATREAAHALELAEAERAYAARLAALRADVVDAEAALAGVRAEAARHGLDRLRPASARRRRLAKRLIASGLFDDEFYRAHCAQALAGVPGASGKSPLAAALHYVEQGFAHGCRPNPMFDSRWYLDRYEDVRRSGVNPLLHYLLDGWREGRDPGPEFQTKYYLEANPDVRAGGVNPLVHYLGHGRHEGRRSARPR